MFPSYEESRLTWCPSMENNGDEWIELFFSTPVYVSSIGIFESYSVGSVYKIEITDAYVDDNMAGCAETRNGPPCSKDSVWRVLWEDHSAARQVLVHSFMPEICHGESTSII